MNGTVATCGCGVRAMTWGTPGRCIRCLRACPRCSARRMVEWDGDWLEARCLSCGDAEEIGNPRMERYLAQAAAIPWGHGTPGPRPKAAS